MMCLTPPLFPPPLIIQAENWKNLYPKSEGEKSPRINLLLKKT